MEERLLPVLALLACWHRRTYAEAFRFSGKKNLGYQRYLILHCLKYLPNLSLKELAQILGVATSGLSLIVDRLKGEGLLVRKENPADRRQVVLTLTPAGETVLEGIEEKMTDKLEKQTGRLKKEERSRLIQILEKLSGDFFPFSSPLK